jgi:hypothetical protein
MAVPTYSCETWTLTKIWMQKIETAEMKFLRNVAGYTVQHTFSSTVIRNELNILYLNNIIQNNWIHRIERKEPERVPNS